MKKSDFETRKKQADAHDKAFPTPRSWEFVSRLLAADPDPYILFDLVAGTVGEGAGVEK